MLTATLAVVPIYSLRLTSRHKTDRAAQAAAFELVSRTGHKSDPPATLLPSFAALQLVYPVPNAMLCEIEFLPALL